MMQSHCAGTAKISAGAQAWQSTPLNRQCWGTRYNTSETVLHTLSKA